MTASSRGMNCVHHDRKAEWADRVAEARARTINRSSLSGGIHEVAPGGRARCGLVLRVFVGGRWRRVFHGGKALVLAAQADFLHVEGCDFSREVVHLRGVFLDPCFSSPWVGDFPLPSLLVI